jgi:hypothetical protein
MSEQEQIAEETGNATGGAALKALAGAAAGGAATYAVRKALASRNGHDHTETEDDERTEHSAEDEHDVSDAQDDEEEEDEYSEDEYPDASAEGDVEYEDDDSDDVTAGSSDRSNGRGGLRRLVTPARLESATQLLLPLAEQAAGSAGRYVGEHAPETVRKQILPRFIDAFEEAH